MTRALPLTLAGAALPARAISCSLGRTLRAPARVVFSCAMVGLVMHARNRATLRDRNIPHLRFRSVQKGAPRVARGFKRSSPADGVHHHLLDVELIARDGEQLVPPDIEWRQIARHAQDGPAALRTQDVPGAARWNHERGTVQPEAVAVWIVFLDPQVTEIVDQHAGGSGHTLRRRRLVEKLELELLLLLGESRFEDRPLIGWWLHSPGQIDSFEDLPTRAQRFQLRIETIDHPQ